MLQKLKNTGLGTRIITASILIVLGVVAVNYIVFAIGFRDSAEQALAEKAAAFTAVADETKNHTAKLHLQGSFAQEQLLEDLQHALDAGLDYRKTDIFNTIPVVAGWTAAQEAAERENIDFRIAAFHARNKDNEPQPGSFRETMLQDLHDQVDTSGQTILTRVNTETNTLHYMRAIQLTADCMMCHGKPGNKYDTDNDGKDPLGFQMESWAVGDMHGAYEVLMPLSKADQQLAGFITNGMMFTVPVIIGALIGLIFMLRYMFAKPVNTLIERIKDIAEGEGDLTRRIEIRSEDELGQLGKWFNRFVQKIHDLIVQVSEATTTVASASTEIASSATEMAQGISEQTAQTTQVSSAVEELSSTVSEVARKSSTACEQAQQAGEHADIGGQTVEQTIAGMNEISDVVNQSAIAVQQLGERSGEIGEIIGVINDIAEQTNLLALNAAIEAARAGEHGRGFAVVADEVRKLADRTTTATEHVAQTIKAIQSETSTAVQRMGEGTERVTSGVTLAQEAGQSLSLIVSSSRQVAEVIQSIAAASEQQSTATADIARNVEHINAVSQQSAQGADQAARACEQLSERAETLQALVNQFKLDPSQVAK